MHEKTLLYSALGATAIAAIFGVYKAKSSTVPIAIAPVALIDASKSVAAAEVPIRLTASDGTGLKLVDLRAEATIEDPLALTELHLVFENPNDRVLEGTFRITLPQGASLSRFAMKVGDSWQEGEVVEKQAARRAYEDFLHRRQDPALLEQGAGNEFSARVFPIPARGRKEIVVTYAEVLEGGAPYVMPLRGLPELGSLDVNVHARGAKSGSEGSADAVFGIHQQRFTPAGDFVVEGKKLPRSPGLRSGDIAIARVVPFASSRPEPVTAAVVLVDTSASRGLGLGEQAREVKKLLGKLAPDAQVSVACFDQEVAPVYEGRASGFGDKEVSAIVSRGALGASDVEQALVWAGEQAKRTKAPRVVLVTDGVATAGETDAQKLRARVESLRAAGVTRMDAVAIGGIRDDAFLRTVVRGVLDKDGVVLDAKLGADALARRLSEATSSGIPVKVDGAKWSWPDKLDGLQAGDEVLVYAEIDPERPLRVTVGTQELAPDLRTIDRPLVERAWAQAKIQSLVEAPTEGAAATKQEIVRLSTRHRVLSPYTALLVLETENDYRRFGIDRRANVDILAVKDGRVAIVQSPRAWEDTLGARAKGEEGSMGDGRRARRDDAPREVEPAPAAAAPADETTATADAEEAPGGPTGPTGGATGLGLSGIGEGGGGRGEGVGLGGLRTLGHGAGTGEGFGAGHAAAPEPPPPTVEARAPRGGGGSAPPPARRAPPRDNAGAPDNDRDGILDAPDPVVRPGALTVEGGISNDEVQRVVRAAVPRLRSCYATELRRDARARGRVSIRVVVDPLGEVKSADAEGAPGGAALNACMTGVMKSLRFPAPGSADARFTQSFDLVNQGGAVDDDGRPSADAVPKALPYEGRFKIVMDALSQGDKDVALAEANRWHADQPGDVLSLVALGEVFEARGDVATAARAYGSILELFSFRADSRRFAGERLERLKDARALRLAADTYGKAAEQRPDHPASHRLYAFTLLKSGEHEKAFEAMKKGAARTYPPGRFAGVDRILKEDLGLIAAAWAKAEPSRAAEIHQKLRDAGGTEESAPSLRFVLVWETDANDVDFHIHDGKGGHAYYSQRELPSGGELYADVTTGYGPECFTIRGPRERRAYPYTLQAHYYARGPMGYGMGKLEIVEHDGSGAITFEERPFVVMIDHAYVDLGTVDKARPAAAAMK